MRMTSCFPPLVVAGCSGAGKGTLIGKLQAWKPLAFGFSVSHTTRGPRPGEEDGVHYHFTDVESMKGEIEAGSFLESANVHGNYYGTSKKAVEVVQEAQQVCILDIDVQGVRQVKAANLDCKYLWVEAPSLELLEGRLRGRGTETEDKIQKRLKNARAELAFAHPDDGTDPPFDAYLVNDDLDATFLELQNLVVEWYPHLAPKPTGPCAAISNLIPCAAKQAPSVA